MLAATAMTIAAGEASWPVVAVDQWTRQYFAMLATPIGTRDIVARASALDDGARRDRRSAVYLAVIAAFGGVNSPLRHPGACLRRSCSVLRSRLRARGVRGNA